MFIIGGNINKKRKNLNWEYNYAQNSIIPRKNMLQERDDFAITYYAKENQIFVFGGYDGKELLNQCEKYSISNDKWTYISRMTT